jgi:signal transduction histidine kinase
MLSSRQETAVLKPARKHAMSDEIMKQTEAFHGMGVDRRVDDARRAGPERERTLRPIPAAGIGRRPWVLVVIAAAIPVLLLGGWVAYRSAASERVAALAATSEVTYRVANQIVAELSTQVQVAEALALSSALDQADLAMFYREAQRIKQSRPLWHTIELDDPSGLQVVNLLRPLGTPLGRTADKDSFDEVLRTLRPTVGGVGPVGPVSGQELVSLRVPVLREGRLRYVLTVLLVPNAINAILRGSGAPEGWVGAVIDGRGNVIAHSVGDTVVPAQPASADARDAVRRAPSGSYRDDRTIEGVEAEVLYRTLPGTRAWSVHLGIPTEILNGPVQRSLYILGAGIAASLGLAGLLAGLVARDIAQRQREEKRVTTEAIRASEERAAIAIAAAELGTWRWAFDANEVVGSERCRVLLDLPETPRGRREWRWSAAEFLAHVYEEDRIKVQEAVRDCLENRSMMDIEFRVAVNEREVSWVRATGRALRPCEECQEVYGVIAGIQERKRAEAERRRLLRRLAEAQEEVQRRISRELHDQVGQTVTGLSLGLKGLESMIGDPNAQDNARGHVRWLQNLAGEIGRDIHRAAADLRPTSIDDLGLQQALNAYASEWSSRHGLAIEVQMLGRKDRLPSEVETVLYRIVQEALTNVLKHAGARNVSLVLERRGDEMKMVIEDDGVGFDPSSWMSDGRMASDRPTHQSLGLSGIRERLALVGGAMTLESGPGIGTTIFITVPVSPQAMT